MHSVYISENKRDYLYFLFRPKRALYNIYGLFAIEKLFGTDVPIARRSL